MSDLIFGYEDQEQIWSKMFKKSVIPLGNQEEYKNRRNLLIEIEDKVRSGRYSPDMHGFLSSPKGGYVARFVPLFSYNDYSTYFACVQSMKSELAACCVEDTFGGWSMGGESRKLEQERAKKIFNPQTDVDEFFGEESMSASSLFPEDWWKQWNQYWLLLSALSTQSGHKTCFVMFDIANFYDSIDLNRLEKQLRSKCPNGSYAIEVLFHLLTTWNRKLNKYERTTKGLPQDHLGDFSRHLSHFHLSQFDSQIKNICEEHDARFLRYADDMVIMADNESSGQKLLFRACEILHSFGLNVNTTKVKFMSSADFESFWGFNVMNNFEQDSNEFALKLLIKRWKDKDYGRKETALRRAITKVSKSKISGRHKEWVFNKSFEQPGFILKLKPSQIKSLVSLHSDPQEAARKIAEIILGEPFTEPKASLISFLHKNNLDQAFKIDELTHQVLKEIERIDDPLLNMSVKNHSSFQDAARNYKAAKTVRSLLNLKPFELPVVSVKEPSLKTSNN